jgi:hypothetical protein
VLFWNNITNIKGIVNSELVWWKRFPRIRLQIVGLLTVVAADQVAPQYLCQKSVAILFKNEGNN